MKIDPLERCKSVKIAIATYEITVIFCMYVYFLKLLLVNESVFKSKNFTFAILSERENRGSLGVVIWQHIFSAKLKEVFWHQTAGEVSELT